MRIAVVSTLALSLAACTNPSISGSAGSGGTAAGVGGIAGFGGTGGTGGGNLVPEPPSGGLAGSTGGLAFNEPVVVARRPPPPIAGGTLLVRAGGHSALVADPDRDQLFVVDLDRPSLAATIALQTGDEPGRSAEDTAGRLHVVLRGAGSVVTVDPVAGLVIERRQVCTYPRGIAYEGAKDAIHVACAGGELVTLPAGGGNATRTLHLDLDLRDVVVDGEHLLVSRFRAAELLAIEPSGAVSGRLRPTHAVDVFAGAERRRTPAVAWRTVAAVGGGALMTFQYEQTSVVSPSPGGYGNAGACGGPIVTESVALLRRDGSVATALNIQAVLPVDIAVDPSTSRMVVAAAGAGMNIGQQPTVELDPPSSATNAQNSSACAGRPPAQGGITTRSKPLGRVVAVGFDWQRQLVVQTREPASVMVGDRAVMLPGESQKDTGHDLFHFATSGGIACASCHPEGREDGHVWNFARFGPRRTQTVGGGIMDTKPFHWDGDMTDFNVLAHEVFESRMSGPRLSATHLAVMEDWIDQIPAWKPLPAENPASAERGKVLFHDEKVACASCHAGAKLTNNKSVDVGTRLPTEAGGRAFQVPSLLGVRWRAPFMHQGCAKTLADRFDPECGGGDLHGRTSHLSDSERADLATYLSTL